MSNATPDRLLAVASMAQRAGRTNEAKTLYAQVLASTPDNAVALNALGNIALAEGEPAVAVDLFRRATDADPAASPLWMNLAKAHRLTENWAGEAEALQSVLDLDQRDLPALIRFAQLHERLGAVGAATEKWTAVLALGRFVDQPSTELSGLLDHAAHFVAETMAAFSNNMEKGLAPRRDPLPRSERRRFDACLDAVLGKRSFYANQCEGLHFPFLPADEFFDLEHFPWLETIKASTPVIRDELLALMNGKESPFQPYVRQAQGTPPNKWTGLNHSLDWGATFLIEYGVVNPDVAFHCPKTLNVLNNLPLCRLPGRAPTAFFSLLKPHSHIPSHTGVSNVRAIVHLPLIVPEGCRFRVGGETRPWREGEPFVFDDTIEHEAWNDSDQLRAVLIFDVWNPHITAVERDLLLQFYALSDGDEMNPSRRMALSELG